MEELLQKSISGLFESLMNKLEDRLKETLKVWGVDSENTKEVAKRCHLVTCASDKINRLLIDGKLALIYTDMEPNINYNDPCKITFSFKCSEIINPQ